MFNENNIWLAACLFSFIFGAVLAGIIAAAVKHDDWTDGFNAGYNQHKSEKGEK